MPPAELGHFPAAFGFLQDRHYLLLAESSLLHVPAVLHSSIRQTDFDIVKRPLSIL
jgi:hypothetical protein